MSTVPIFAPDGTLGDVPYEQFHAAIAAGAKPGVTIKAPDGSLGVVPADRTQDAVKAGGQLVPFEEQETQHPGFWHAVASNIAALPGVISNAVSLGSTPIPGHAGFDPLPAENAAALARADTARKARGEGLPERAGSAIATMAGTNVPGMERSAAEGDVGGVLGHAVSGMAMAAAPLLAEGALGVGEKALPPLARAAKATGGAIKDVATPENIGTAVGGAAGYHAGGYFGGATGAAAGRLLGKALAKRIADNLAKLPDADTGAEVYRDATLNKRNIPEYAGEEEGENAPATIPENGAPQQAAAGSQASPSPAAASASPAAQQSLTRTPTRLSAQDLTNALKDSLVELEARPSKFPPQASDIAPVYDRRYVGPVDIDTIESIRNNPRYADEVRDDARMVHEAVLDSGMPIDDAMRSYGGDALAKVLGGKIEKTLNGQFAESRPAPRTIVLDPETGRPEFSDVVAAKKPPQSASADVDTRAGVPKAKNVNPATVRKLQSAMAKASRGQVEGISPGEWNAIEEIETQVSGTPKPDEDLTDILTRSLEEVRARKAQQQP